MVCSKINKVSLIRRLKNRQDILKRQKIWVQIPVWLLSSYLNVDNYLTTLGLCFLIYEGEGWAFSEVLRLWSMSDLQMICEPS